MRLLPSAVLLLLSTTTLLACASDPDVVVDDTGVTSLHVRNDSAAILEVSFVPIEPTDQPAADITIQPGTTALVTEGWGIGGWMQVPEVVSSITVRDAATDAVLIQQGPTDFEGWVVAPDSTWERSELTLTVP